MRKRHEFVSTERISHVAEKDEATWQNEARQFRHFRQRAKEKDKSVFGETGKMEQQTCLFELSYALGRRTSWPPSISGSSKGDTTSVGLKPYLKNRSGSI